MVKDYKSNKLRELNEVFKYTKEKIKSSKEISIERNRESIELIFDMNIGFGGFEKVTVEIINNCFVIKYSALCFPTFDTFLTNKRYLKNISKYLIIKKFREEVDYIRKEGKYEITAEKYQKEGKLYTQFIYLEEKNTSIEDIYAALEFFIKIFEDKLKNPQRYTWRLLC